MIQVTNLSYAFKIGKKEKENVIPVLHDVNLHVGEGEIVAIVGRSGSGKSTLLNLISGFIQAETGAISINGTQVSGLSESKWAEFRLNHLGFIFQSFQLIPSMTAYENVELPLVLKGCNEKDRKERTTEMLKRVGLEQYQSHYPGELSGGSSSVLV